MGQSATLYRIDENDFPKILNNPDDFKLFDIAKEFVTFEKTFEGLRFVLSKGRDKKVIELVDQIFYPKTFIGKEIDYANLDLDNISDDFDLFKQPVYYNDADKVLSISLFLDTISIDELKTLFNPDELNRENIYPRQAWNRHTEENYFFNERDIIDEFKKLKEIFQRTRVSHDYLLSYVG